MYKKQIFSTSIVLLIAAILLLSVTACGGKDSSPTINKDALDGPSEVMTVYKSNCISCHGTGLQGRVGPNTNLQQVGARMSASDIAAQIEHGKGSMPAFQDRLTDEEIAGLSEWLASKK